MLKIKNLKKSAYSGLVGLLITTLLAPSALAASFTLQENGPYIKGCSGNFTIKIDAAGSEVVSADMTLGYNSSEVAIGNIAIGSAIPMDILNEANGTDILLSAMRIGSYFTGNATFGTVDFTPGSSASSGTFTFSQDFTYGNTIADKNSNNVITAAGPTSPAGSEGKYIISFLDRYNTEVDGVGFCTPDTQSPTVDFKDPRDGQGSVDLDSNVIFTISDNRTNVKRSSIAYSIRGVDYVEGDTGVTVEDVSGTFKVVTDPASDFNEGESVDIEVYACDNNSPANCSTSKASFTAWSPPPPDPVCGDGHTTWSIGEQCDDGNTVDGDGCDSLCLLETEECPVCEEATVCEDAAEDAAEEPAQEPADEPTEEPDEEPAEIDEEAPYEQFAVEEDILAESIVETIAYEGIDAPGCSRGEMLIEIDKKFSANETWATYDAFCEENKEDCMIPFAQFSSFDKYIDFDKNLFYPDVVLTGKGTVPGETIAPVSQAEYDAIAQNTIRGVTSGFYLDTEHLSPFRPTWTASRGEAIKMYATASGLVPNWLYKSEFDALYPNGIQANASDIDPRVKPYQWWYARYYNAACDAQIISPCGKDIPSNFEVPLTPKEKQELLTNFLVWHNKNTTAREKDTDNDLLNDYVEIYNFNTDINSNDTDNDQLEDYDEIYEYHTNPNKEDTDGDYLTDYVEIVTYKTNPLKFDSDDDGFSDKLEIDSKSDPLNALSFPQDANSNDISDTWESQYGVVLNGVHDDDGDGLSNAQEFKYGTNPLMPDTDNDGMTDSYEIFISGTDPLVSQAGGDLAITNLSDGMTISSTPFIQGFTPEADMDVEVILRSLGGEQEIVLTKTQSSEDNVFITNIDQPLRDGQMYLLAKVIKEGKITESPLIRVTVDSKLLVKAPTIERISNKVVEEGKKIVIDDVRPIAEGTSALDDNVVAIWQSVTGASAIVADLAGGEFTLQAPHDLDYGKHTVSLYSVRAKDQAMSQLTIVEFEVVEPLIAALHGIATGEEVALPWYVWTAIFLLGVGLIAGGMGLHKRFLGKKD